MTLDNMTGITKGSYTGFCKSQLITCNFVKACNGVCPFEDALKHADKTQTMNEQHTVDHDREWVIGCIQHAILRKITGHEYGCCNKVFKRCSKCIYVREDGEA